MKEVPPLTLRFFAKNEESMKQQGRSLAARLQPNDCLCFFGDLGSGKTTYIAGISSFFSEGMSLVSSPTYSYLHIYAGKLSLYHFDLYRLRGVEDFLGMGFDEYLEAGGICCIEWAEKIAPCLPQNRIEIHIQYAQEEGREVVVLLYGSKNPSRWKDL